MRLVESVERPVLDIPFDWIGKMSTYGSRFVRVDGWKMRVECSETTTEEELYAFGRAEIAKHVLQGETT